MNINRVELMKKIRSAIARKEKEAAVRRKEALVKADQDARDYFNRYQEPWGKFADVIREKIHKAEPITLADVPEELLRWEREIRLYNPAKINESNYVARTGDLTTLLMVLNSCPDEFVTDSSLSRMGVPLRGLMKP